MAITPFVCVPIFAAFRLYNVSRLSPAEEFRRIPGAVTLCVAAFLVVGFWSQTNYSRFWVSLTWIFALLIVLTTRRIWHWAMGRQRRAGKLAFRTLIVGTNEEARRIARSMTGVNGYTAAGFVCPKGDYVRLEGLPVYELDDLLLAIPEVGAECVYVASTAVTPVKMAAVTKALRDAEVEVRVSANISDILSTRLSLQQVGGLMALSLRRVRLSGGQAAVKRTMDLALGGLAILLSLPLWTILALAIKLDSRGPVFYRQERIGRHRKPFGMLKFRTMVVGADTMLEDLRDQNEATGPLFKLRRDPRVTRLGRFLRRWSLDELPQLWNVLKGDMSLVGPRPPLRWRSPPTTTGISTASRCTRGSRASGRSRAAATCRSTTTSGWTCSTSRTGRSPTTCTSWRRPSPPSSPAAGPSRPPPALVRPRGVGRGDFRYPCRPGPAFRRGRPDSETRGRA